MATPAELRAQAQALLEKASALEEAERKKALDGVLKTLSDLGISVNELLEYAKPLKKRGKVAQVPKYAGPNGATWNGHGRQPAWFSEALKSGKSRESMQIDNKGGQ